MDAPDAPLTIERLRTEVRSLRHALAESEMEEEAHVNTLLRTVHTLKREKVDVSSGMERENEFLLHRLSASVRKAQQERDEALAALAREQAAGAARVRACSASIFT